MVRQATYRVNSYGRDLEAFLVGKSMRSQTEHPRADARASHVLSLGLAPLPCSSFATVLDVTWHAAASLSWLRRARRLLAISLAGEKGKPPPGNSLQYCTPSPSNLCLLG